MSELPGQASDTTLHLATLSTVTEQRAGVLVLVVIDGANRVDLVAGSAETALASRLR